MTELLNAVEQKVIDLQIENADEDTVFQGLQLQEEITGVGVGNYEAETSLLSQPGVMDVGYALLDKLWALMPKITDMELGALLAEGATILSNRLTDLREKRAQYAAKRFNPWTGTLG